MSEDTAFAIRIWLLLTSAIACGIFVALVAFAMAFTVFTAVTSILLR